MTPATTPTLTHGELVRRAWHWLKNSQGCSVVVTRACLAADEQPDAIGWDSRGVSVLVECKVSRGDFLRDRKKPHRLHASLGMGDRRFYLSPPGLLSPDELPEGWGLLECLPARLRRKKDSAWFGEKDRAQELRHLLAQFRREPTGCREWFGEGSGI